MWRPVFLLLLATLAFSSLEPKDGSWRRRIKEFRRERMKASSSVSHVTAFNKPDAGKQLFHQSEDTAVYTTARVSKHTGSTPTFAFGTWLNEPVFGEALDVNGKSLFQFGSDNPQAEFAVSAARHIDSISVGDIDVAVAEYDPFNQTCSVSGWASTGKNIGGPRWFYAIPACDVYLTGFDEDLVSISDDGSTVAYAVWSNHSSTGGPDYPSPSSQLHVLNAQTGQLLFVYDLHDSGEPIGELHVTMSRHGEYIAFNNGAYVHVLEKATGALRTAAPFNKGFSDPASICPMGVFLVMGFEDAMIAKWDAPSKSYVVKYTIPGMDSEGEQWFCWTAVTVVNGGGSAADGCLVAFGWANQPSNQARVTVHSMLTGKQYWDWRSWQDENIQTVPELSFHMQYLAVASWGNDNGTAATVNLFNLKSGNPIWNFTTPGSMFDIDVLVDSAKIPPLDAYKTYEDMPKIDDNSSPLQAATDVVYVTASGKHVPASVMGNGGDAYAWQLNF